MTGAEDRLEAALRARAKRLLDELGLLPRSDALAVAERHLREACALGALRFLRESQISVTKIRGSGADDDDDSRT
jgi:hypothetical protein